MKYIIISLVILFIGTAVFSATAAYAQTAEMREEMFYLRNPARNIFYNANETPGKDGSIKDYNAKGTAGKPEDYIVYDLPLSEELQQYVQELCAENGLPVLVVFAVMKVESGYQADALGDGGESYGLMQINRCNHESLDRLLGITDFMDPRQNILAGTYLLAGLMDTHGDIGMALMAYKLGSAGAERLYWSRGIYENEYSRKVMELAEQIKGKPKVREPAA